MRASYNCMLDGIVHLCTRQNCSLQLSETLSLAVCSCWNMQSEARALQLIESAACTAGRFGFPLCPCKHPRLLRLARDNRRFSPTRGQSRIQIARGSSGTNRLLSFAVVLLTHSCKLVTGPDTLHRRSARRCRCSSNCGHVFALNALHCRLHG